VATTSYQIKVSAALLAQTFTIFAAEYLDRQVEKYLLSNYIFQVDRIAFEDVGFKVVGGNFLFLIGREMFRIDVTYLKIYRDRPVDPLQTPDAIHNGRRIDMPANIGLSDPPRNRARRSDFPDELYAVYVEVDLFARDFEIERPRIVINTA
jgi:hypothetical protein